MDRYQRFESFNILEKGFAILCSNNRPTYSDYIFLNISSLKEMPFPKNLHISDILTLVCRAEMSLFRISCFK